MSPLVAAVVLAWIAIVLLAFALAGVLRQLFDLRTALVGSEATSRPPGPIAGLLVSDAASKDSPWHPQGSILFFLDDTCVSCRNIWAELSSIDSPLRSAVADAGLEAVVYFRDSAIGTADPVPTLREARETFERLNIVATPSLALVDGAGRVRSGTPAGSVDAVLKFLAEEAPHHHVSETTQAAPRG